MLTDKNIDDFVQSSINELLAAFYTNSLDNPERAVQQLGRGLEVIEKCRGTLMHFGVKMYKQQE